MLATPEYIVSDLARELEELEAERLVLKSLNDDLGITFIDAADAKVREQITKAADMNSEILRDAIEKAKKDAKDIADRTSRRAALDASRKRDKDPVSKSDDAPDTFLSSITLAGTSSTSGRQPKARKNLNPPPPSNSTYYYYQSAQGTPIFLHPLDIRILLSHFRSYAAFPDNISVRVEAAQEGTVNDDLRKRCKYLAHLPEGADVVFIEADLEGVVGDEALKPFEGALKMRRTRRREKGRKDERARLRAEERERERFHIATHGSFTSARAVPQPAEKSLDVRVDPDPTVSLEDTNHDDDLHQDLEEHVAAAPSTGAWGSRSFAGVVHAAPDQARQPVAAQHEEEDEDVLEIDRAWQDLEIRAASGGKKRRSRLVVLGSGGPGLNARRRR